MINLFAVAALSECSDSNAGAIGNSSLYPIYPAECGSDGPASHRLGSPLCSVLQSDRVDVRSIGRSRYFFEEILALSRASGFTFDEKLLGSYALSKGIEAMSKEIAHEWNDDRGTGHA